MHVALKGARRRVWLVGGVVLTSLAVATPVAAHDNWGDNGKHTAKYADSVVPVPHDHMADKGSNVKGYARLNYNAHKGTLSVAVVARGLSPNLPHLIHIHGDPTKKVNDCPGPDARARRVDDGLIDTVEGLPDYGPIIVTFSTSGGTGDMNSPDALDLARAPMSNAKGEIWYRRTFPVSQTVGRNLDKLHVVIHGLDLSQNAAYDGRAGSLGPNVPLEAELPVSCGAIHRTWGHSHH